MRRSKGGEEDQLQLHKKFHHLDQDWASYKKSMPRHRNRHHRSPSTTTTTTTPNFLNLLHNSPKKLISSLQETQPLSTRSSTALSTGDSSLIDIITAKKTAIKSGKFKGRKLLKDLRGVRDVHEEICIQGDGIESSCSCCSSPIDGYVEYYNVRYISSSSSSSKLSLESVKKEEVRVGERRESGGASDGHGEKWVLWIGGFAIALVILAFGLISYVEFGMEEYVEYMTPT